VQSCQARLEACFKRHAPEKLSRVAALLSKYEGQEDEFVARVERKYSFGRVDMNRAGAKDRGVKLPQSAPGGTAMGTGKAEHSSTGNASHGEGPSGRGDCTEEALAKVLAQEGQLLPGFDRAYPPQVGTAPDQVERLADIETFSNEQEELRYRRLHGHERASEVEGYCMLPPIHGGTRNNAGFGGAPGKAEAPWAPPPKPSVKQVGAAERLVLGDRASAQVEYQHSEATIVPRVELDAFVQDKEERMNRKYVGAKAISTKMFDPFA
jgi:hypothetical protein